ncbi:Ig-like domain-containing protein [Thalassolituus sp. LLYu03]|uniref:Ig-like domain-containing protein n=1 Tax=Thalassolituus sp. LLYu03 TaxID=3421656 RepID=UPI003D2BA191
MFKPTALTTLLLAAMLTACGGDSSGSVLGSSDSSSDGGQTDTVDDGSGGTDTVTTDTTIERPRLGTGSGSTFVAGALEVSSSSLSAGGTTNVSANIVDPDNSNAKIVSKQYGVEFTSSCSEADPAKAAFSRGESITSSGEVSVTYEAKGCAGTDIISFKLYDAIDGIVDKTAVLHTATATVSVQAPEVGAIAFVETSAPAISISTISNPVLPKLTEVSFVVLDRTNNPIEGKTVTFALTNAVGGISLAQSSAVTNENGIAKVSLQSGSTHAMTTVIATTVASDGVTKISTSSQAISVTTTGLPDQNSFDVVADILNPGSYDVSGILVVVTAFVGDHFNNPVPDGTLVNFIAESGLIPASCPTKDGSCSVTWKSAGYRPGQENSSQYASQNWVNETDPRRSGASVSGLTTILAYTVGEPGFTDLNADGVFDSSEPFVALPEAILDSDILNATLNADTTDLDAGSEEFVDFDADNVRDSAPTVYEGALCSTAALGLGHCASLVHVRDTVVIAQADSNETVLELYTRAGNVFTAWDGDLDLDDNNAADDAGTFYVFLTDVNRSMPANGTTLEVTGDGYEITGESGSVGNTVGLIPSAYTGLSSSFGKLYRVEFATDVSPKKIELTVTSGGAKSSVILRPTL